MPKRNPILRQLVMRHHNKLRGNELIYTVTVSSFLSTPKSLQGSGRGWRVDILTIHESAFRNVAPTPHNPRAPKRRLVRDANQPADPDIVRDERVLAPRDVHVARDLDRLDRAAMALLRVAGVVVIRRRAAFHLGQRAERRGRQLLEVDARRGLRGRIGRLVGLRDEQELAAVAGVVADVDALVGFLFGRRV